MKLHHAEQHEVNEAERRIDSHFQTIPFPHENHACSKWHLTTAFEDGLRNALWILTRNIQVEDLNRILPRFMLQVDRWKYALRYGLERIYREQPLTALVAAKPDVVAAAYESAAEFLKIGDDYLLAARAFTSYHNGNCLAFRNSRGNVLALTPPNSTITYSALDLLLEGKQDVGTPLMAVVQSFMWPDLPELHVEDILTGTRANGERIEYHFNPFICNALISAIPKPATIVPSQWIFPWGDSSEAHKVFEGLHARCFFHLIAVHYGAIRFGIRGYGVADICPIFPKAQLISNLSEVTGVKSERVTAIIDALSYATATQTPDPALQPIIPISDTHVLVPTLLVLSSNFPRNFLALHARIDSKSFDAQSHAFEVGMSMRVEGIVKKRLKTFWMHKYLPNRKDAGEVDLLVADEASQTILVAELRWLLPPGDPREVNNRKKVCAEKVGQLKRKVVAAQTDIETLLKGFGISGDSSVWKAVGIVVIEGYAAPGPEPESLPVVPLRVFEIGLAQCADLKCLHAWLAGHTWLPQKNTHFVSGRVTVKFGSQQLQWGGLNVQHHEQYFPDLRFNHRQ